MQKVGLFLFLLFLFPKSLFALEPCAQKNFIFLLHGVAGSEDTFGHLSDYLRNTDRCFEIIPFEYETGSNRKDARDFAEDFYIFAEEAFIKKGGTDRDKISLIMHSQGGLVGSLWINQLKKIDHPFLHQLDAFISLSTPYWGAGIADIGKKIFYSGINYNPIAPFGKAELNEMSFGSRTINQIYDEFHDTFNLPNLRPLALGGLKKFSNFIIGEDDLVVPIYSSRPDHYRVIESQSLKRGPASIQSHQFEKTNYFKFVTVRSNHFNFTLPGIASVPFKCLLLLKCEHPAVKYIVKHLKGEEVQESKSLFHRFRVQIFLENETKSIPSFKNARLSILDKDGTWIPKYQALKRYRGRANNKEGKAFTFHGVYLKQGQRMIKVKVALKNEFERIFEIPVEGGHTSIINLNLAD